MSLYTFVESHGCHYGNSMVDDLQFAGPAVRYHAKVVDHYATPAGWVIRCPVDG